MIHVGGEERGGKGKDRNVPQRGETCGTGGELSARQP